MPTCPECGADSVEGARFCASCGASLVRACSECGESLPSEARFCPACGAAAGSTRKAGEMLKVVTVLFADVVSSTPRAEALHPEDARALMADYFQAMAGEIRAEGGTIEKFIGDAIMAVFGVPVAHEDDAARAVRAGRRMLARLDRWNADREPDARLEIRVGVNTGEVLAAGVAGQDLLVTGDAVNVASRLQEAAEPGTILVGERTARAVESVFELEPGEPLALKGKRELMRAWRVLGEREPAEESVVSARAPIVGRDSELERMRSLFAGVCREHAPHLLTVIGEAGVGKSRLARELAASLEDDVKVLVGRCAAYGEGVALKPLAEILRSELLVAEDDPPELVRFRVEELVRNSIPEALAADRDRISTGLATTLGVTLPGESEPPQTFRALRAAWRVLLSGLAAESPLIVVIEDLHWADAALLDVLDDVAEHVEGAVFFLCLARPDLLRSRPDWGGGRRNFSSLPLDPLSRDESAELVSFLVEAGELPAGLRARMLDRAEGNPFFLEEIVQSLIDRGRMRRGDTGWVAVEDAAIDVPDSVQAVVLARIDMLEPEEKHALQQAAVAGRTFWAGTLAHLAPGDDVGAILQVLRRRELVVERLSSRLRGEVEYAFKHVLIRDVAYESLPRRARGRAHAAVAEWMEAQRGERAEELAELLAHHYERAFTFLGEERFRVQARSYALRASRSALRRFALEQAERYARLGVDLSVEGAERVAALGSLAELYGLAFRGDAAWESYREAIAEARRSSPADRRTLARLAAEAAVLATRWSPAMHARPAPAELEEVIGLGLDAVGTGPSRERVQLLSASAFAQIYAYAPMDESGERAAHEAVSLAEQLGDSDLVSGALDAVAAGLTPAGRWDDVLRIVERRLELVPHLRDTLEVCDAHAMASQTHLAIGRYGEAAMHATACVENSRHEDATQYVQGLTFRVRARFAVGDWEGALSDEAEIERVVGGGAPPPYAEWAYGTAAFCHELRGERAEADRYVEALLASGERSGVRAARLASLVARTLAHKGRAEEALAVLSLEPSAQRAAQLEAACEVVAEIEDWERAAGILTLAREQAALGKLLALGFFADRLEGRAAAAAGDIDDAERFLRGSTDGFAELGAPWEAAWSSLLLAELGRQGSSHAAEQSLAVFQSLGSVDERTRAEALIAAGRPAALQ